MRRNIKRVRSQLSICNSMYSRSYYDRTALTNALKLVEQEMLDTGKSQYKRVRFSFLMSKVPFAHP